MSKTQAQLIEQALLELDAIAEGESVTADESTRMGYAYASLLELLEIDNLAWWPANTIPDGVFWILGKLLAEFVKEHYGREDYTSGTARMQLQRIAAKKSAKQNVRSVYY